MLAAVVVVVSLWREMADDVRQRLRLFTDARVKRRCSHAWHAAQWTLCTVNHATPFSSVLPSTTAAAWPSAAATVTVTVAARRSGVAGLLFAAAAVVATVWSHRSGFDLT